MLIYVLLAVLIALACVQIFFTLRQKTADRSAELFFNLEKGFAKTEATIRDEFSRNRNESSKAASDTRQELSLALKNVADSVSKNMADIIALVQKELNASREESARSLKSFEEKFGNSVKELNDQQRLKFSDLMLNQEKANQQVEQRLEKMRETIEGKLKLIQEDNNNKLEQMRQTVDEKLHKTLETRLGESFKIVSERLELVHKGLGEMQNLATGVGDLKRVLTNVKTRGTWGEVQLELLLEQMLTPEQYAKNVETIKGTGERVEFAIKLPGREDNGVPVWLPIDAKFPKEQYERLVDASEKADAEGVTAAGKELERAIRNEAKTIATKYLSPPLTTDFALLFLPTEGLYAEVMRRQGLADELQRTFRVSIAGPSTLSALLNSLQMGFRTLTIQKRSSEVWEILSKLKKEFGTFGDVLEKTRTKLEQATREIGNAETRTRVIQRTLKKVEGSAENDALSQATSGTSRLLGLMNENDEPEAEVRFMEE
jgi:DNA recombination protein RmuC